MVFLSIIYTNACFCVESGRKPAYFALNDGLILRPEFVIEEGPAPSKNFIERFHENYATSFSAAKSRLELWSRNEEYAQMYGLGDSGIVELPTYEQRQEFFERNYLRFFTRHMQRVSNESLQDIARMISEQEAIDHQEVRFEARDESVKNSSKKQISKQVKTLSGQKLDFHLNPRPEIGMVDLRLKSEVFEIRAWLGINNQQELQLRHQFKSTGTHIHIHHYIDEKRTVSRVKQPINLKLRMEYRMDHIEQDSPVNATGDLLQNHLLGFYYYTPF